MACSTDHMFPQLSVGGSHRQVSTHVLRTLLDRGNTIWVEVDRWTVDQFFPFHFAALLTVFLCNPSKFRATCPLYFGELFVFNVADVESESDSMSHGVDGAWLLIQDAGRRETAKF